MVKSIETLIKEEPKIEKYINIIKERSDDINSDIRAIEYLSINHTSEQICDFLPRYISISGWSERLDELQNEYFEKHEFLNNGNIRK